MQAPSHENDHHIPSSSVACDVYTLTELKHYNSSMRLGGNLKMKLCRRHQNALMSALASSYRLAVPE